MPCAGLLASLTYREANISAVLKFDVGLPAGCNLYEMTSWRIVSP
jgi:hypothetical protein